MRRRKREDGFDFLYGGKFVRVLIAVFYSNKDFIFEKRTANFIRRYKIAYFYVKIGL